VPSAEARTYTFPAFRLHHVDLGGISFHRTPVPGRFSHLVRPERDLREERFLGDEPEVRRKEKDKEDGAGAQCSPRETAASPSVLRARWHKLLIPEGVCPGRHACQRFDPDDLQRQAHAFPFQYPAGLRPANQGLGAVGTLAGVRAARPPPEEAFGQPEDGSPAPAEPRRPGSCRRCLLAHSFLVGSLPQALPELPVKCAAGRLPVRRRPVSHQHYSTSSLRKNDRGVKCRLISADLKPLHE